MKQQILVVGAGFGGLWSALSAARLLDQHDRADIEISVIAPQPELRIRPRFYEQNVHQMKAPLGELFKAVGVKFIQGSANKIDADAKRVFYTDVKGNGIVLNYDRLVLASGSRAFRPRLPGINEYTFDVDQIEEAAKLENHITALRDLPESAARNTVVVVGGGFTGIETATEMPARLRAALGADADIKVIVVDRGSDIGIALGDQLRPVIAEASASLGVQWILNASAASIDADGVTLADGQRIDAKTVIWAAGLRANVLTEQLNAERDPLGRLHVDQNLKVIGLDDIFASGDVAYAASDDIGNHAAMSCQHAIALGRAAGNNVAASLLGVDAIPYSQPKYVTCLDLGAWGAVYTEGWDRQIKLIKDEAKQLKTQINTQWIYPPAANRAEALAAADPLIPVVA